MVVGGVFVVVVVVVAAAVAVAISLTWKREWMRQTEIYPLAFKFISCPGTSAAPAALAALADTHGEKYDVWDLPTVRRNLDLSKK